MESVSSLSCLTWASSSVFFSGVRHDPVEAVIAGSDAILVAMENGGDWCVEKYFDMTGCNLAVNDNISRSGRG